MAASSVAAGSSRRNGMRLANPYQSSYAQHRGIVPSSGGGRHPRDHDDADSSPDGSRAKPSPQRKRVVVACGRCRKRKIRCSGDDGRGSACTNCRNSGEPHCLFLRVSKYLPRAITAAADRGIWTYHADRHKVASSETMLKAGSTDFGYQLEACRRYQSRGSTAVQPMGMPQGGSPQGTMASQMETPVNLYTGEQSYVYGTGARDFALPNWSAGSAGYAADASIGYGMYPQGFSGLAVQDPSYMYQQGDQTSVGMGDRSGTSLAQQAGAFSLQNMAQGLPNVNERFLPTPIHRPLPSNILPSSRGSTSSSLYSRTSYPSTANGSPAGTALTEMSPNYGYEDSSAGQYSALPLLSSSHAVQRMPDMYTTSQAEAMLPTAGETLRSQASTSPDMTYRYQDTTRRPDAVQSSPVTSLGESPQLDGAAQQM